MGVLHPESEMSKFQNRLTELGLKTYQQYLESEFWKGFKRRYAEARQPDRCRVCGSTDSQLHHVTYDRLGCERFEDVVPLCKDHHDAVHRWLKTSGKVLVCYTAEVVAELCRRRNPKTGNSVGRKKKRRWIHAGGKNYFCPCGRWRKKNKTLCNLCRDRKAK